MWEILARGGVLMIPIGLCSLIGGTIILERAYRFWRARNDSGPFMAGVMEAVRAGRTGEALAESRRRRGPLASVIAAGIEQTKGADTGSVEKVVSRVGSRELRSLETHLRGLSVIANVAPLLGLLGTVVGMIRAFMQIEAHGGRVDVSMLAGGIWEAMMTTAAGLSVAIPCLLFYNFFMSRITHIEEDMREHANDLIETLKENEGGGL